MARYSYSGRPRSSALSAMSNFEQSGGTGVYLRRKDATADNRALFYSCNLEANAVLDGCRLRVELLRRVQLLGHIPPPPLPTQLRFCFLSPPHHGPSQKISAPTPMPETPGSLPTVSASVSRQLPCLTGSIFLSSHPFFVSFLHSLSSQPFITTHVDSS
jgi:hypothetical protein